jgi:hypothetical protein
LKIKAKTKPRTVIIESSDLEQEVRHLSHQVASLSLKVQQLENPDRNLVWMTVNDAANHPQLKGKISAKQIRDRVIKSISDPVEAPLTPNVHYQIVPGNGTRTKYVVNAIELVKWLENATANTY